MYFIVGALIEVPVAAFFLYNLLGWSAFAGFVVLILASPAQSFIMKRNIKVRTGNSGRGFNADSLRRSTKSWLKQGTSESPS